MRKNNPEFQCRGKPVTWREMRVIPECKKNDSPLSSCLDVSLPGQATALIRDPGAAKRECVEKIHKNKSISLAALGPGSALRLSGEQNPSEIQG